MIAKKISFVKSVYSLLVSFLAVLLHSLCCLLPVLSVTTSASLLTLLLPYKSSLLFVQVLTIIYLIYRVFQNRRKNPEHSHYLDTVMLIIAIAGFVFSYLEPFKTERRVLAERQFALFKSNRSLTIQFRDNRVAEFAAKDLREISGIRKVRISNQEIQVSYNVEQIKREKIIDILRVRNYRFGLK